MSKKISILDLNKELFLRIDGEVTKLHAVPWDVLRNVGDKLQSLVQTIAKYSLSNDEFTDLNNYSISLFGFYEGSAIPAFRLNPTPIPNLFNTDAKVKNVLNADFSRVMYFIDLGNYQAIADIYDTAMVKNDVISKVFEFTNSAGTAPVEIVRRQKGKDEKQRFVKIYNVRKLNRDVFDQLIIKDQASKNVTKIPDQSAVGKIIVRQNKSGRTTKKAIEVYSEKEAVLSVSFNQIKALDRIYELTHDLLFRFFEEGKGIIIENSQLDLYAAGDSLVNAEINLFTQFDHTYQRLITLSDDQLNKRLLRVKQYYLFIIKNIKQL